MTNVHETTREINLLLYSHLENGLAKQIREFAIVSRLTCSESLVKLLVGKSIINTPDLTYYQLVLPGQTSTQFILFPGTPKEFLDKLKSMKDTRAAFSDRKLIAKTYKYIKEMHADYLHIKYRFSQKQNILRKNELNSLFSDIDSIEKFEKILTAKYFFQPHEDGSPMHHAPIEINIFPQEMELKIKRGLLSRSGFTDEHVRKAWAQILMERVLDR